MDRDGEDPGGKQDIETIKGDRCSPDGELDEAVEILIGSSVAWDAISLLEKRIGKIVLTVRIRPILSLSYSY
jgi:hypothetical protein